MNEIILTHLIWFVPIGIVIAVVLIMFMDFTFAALFPPNEHEEPGCERCGASQHEACHDYTTERRQLCPRISRNVEEI